METGSVFGCHYRVTASGQGTKAEKAAGNAGGSEKKLSEAAELSDFKRKFYDDLSRIVPYKTTRDTTLIISEEAFLKMKEDPAYREKVLALIRRDWGNYCGPGKYKVLITVGADLKDYRASSWPVSNGRQCSRSRRYVRKKLYKKLRKKRLEKKERLEEYLEGEMMIKRLVQALRNEEAANEMLLRKYKELRECW